MSTLRGTFVGHGSRVSASRCGTIDVNGNRCWGPAWYLLLEMLTRNANGKQICNEV